MLDSNSTALFHFIVILAVWVLLPLIPAWATYRITPDQGMGLKGPFQGMTLRATGSFVAYLVIAMLLSVIAWPMGKLLLGKVAADSTWVIKGKTAFYDDEGKPISAPPDIRNAYVTIKPDPNVIDADLEIKLPFAIDRKPTVYIEVPDWGGARISLGDSESYNEDTLSRHIILKNEVSFRQQPRQRLSIGETK